MASANFALAGADVAFRMEMTFHLSIPLARQAKSPRNGLRRNKPVHRRRESNAIHANSLAGIARSARQRRGTSADRICRSECKSHPEGSAPAQVQSPVGDSGRELSDPGETGLPRAYETGSGSVDCASTKDTIMHEGYSHGSYVENHQRAAELHESAAHAHTVWPFGPHVLFGLTERWNRARNAHSNTRNHSGCR